MDHLIFKKEEKFVLHICPPPFLPTKQNYELIDIITTRLVEYRIASPGSANYTG